MDIPETPPSEPTPKPPIVEVLIDSDAEDIARNKDIAAFSYLWIMSVVVFFLRGKSPFVRYHAKQAMLLCLLSIIVMLIPIISRLLLLGVLALMVWGFLNAAQGKRKQIPIVGPLAHGEMSIREAWKQIIDAILKAIAFLKSHKPSKPATPPADTPPTPPTPPQP